MVPHAKVCIGWCKRSAHCSTLKLQKVFIVKDKSVAQLILYLKTLAVYKKSLVEGLSTATGIEHKCGQRVINLSYVINISK